MNRREALLSSLAAIPAMAGTAAAAATGPSDKTGRLPPSKLKLGCQSGPSTPAHFAFLARYGVKNICANAVQDDKTRLYPTVAELKRLKEMAAEFGQSVDITSSVLLQSTHVDKEKYAAIMLADSPERERDIEAFQLLIRNCAEAGIPCVKYNMSLLGVLRNVTKRGRGDVEYQGWDYSKAPADPGLTRAGKVDDERYWERITYFLDKVVPVANENRVRIACHPNDPGVPPSGYQGISPVLGTIDGLKRFITIRESAYHGLNFCQGTVSENLKDPSREIFDVIRYFGSRKKIFNVHFRNITGGRDKFFEAFPDTGDVDMFKAALTYREVGYDGMLMPDHVPLVVSDKPGNPYGYNLNEAQRADDGHESSFAFAYGYIRGIIQAVEHHA